MGVTLAGSSEGTPFYRNCNDIALQLQWPKGYVETSVAPTGIQIGARAQLFETKRTRFSHVSHSARLSDTGFKPGDYQKLQCIRYNFFLHFLVSEFHVKLQRRALDHLCVVIFVFAPSEMGSLTNFTTTMFNLHHISFVSRSECDFGSTIGMCE